MYSYCSIKMQKYFQNVSHNMYKSFLSLFLNTGEALGLEHWCNSVLCASAPEELEGVLHLPQPNPAKNSEYISNIDICTHYGDQGNEDDVMPEIHYHGYTFKL